MYNSTPEEDKQTVALHKRRRSRKKTSVFDKTLWTKNTKIRIKLWSTEHVGNIL